MSGATIFALSSGQLPSGVALIRVSGPQCRKIMLQMLGAELTPRQATLRELHNPKLNEILDEIIAIWFPGPSSFTGEDVLEFQCHGGIATVSAILDALSTFNDCRLADAGEFSRRAFENGRLDLTELEGLSDLIAAQTEGQRRQASAQASGDLRKLYDRWRTELIRIRSHLEAELDFSDEGDVDDNDLSLHRIKIKRLLREVGGHLDDGNRGEITRRGFNVVLAGPPNAGKSSLLNALAKRDIAIVTPHAGTTRDVVQVQLDILGHLVIVSDTAGLRETDSEIEQAGMGKSLEAIQSADLVLWLQDSRETSEFMPDNAIRILTKADLDPFNTDSDQIKISTVTKPGIEAAISVISEELSDNSSTDNQAFISRKRHREELELTVRSLQSALAPNLEHELICENLRIASDSIGRVTGRIDVEDLLDVIFSEFCIGK